MNISSSEYTKIFRVNDNIYACYNSLKMIPVYLTADEYTKLQTALTNGTVPDIPESTLESLMGCRIFSSDDDADLIQIMNPENISFLRDNNINVSVSIA